MIQRNYFWLFGIFLILISCKQKSHHSKELEEMPLPDVNYDSKAKEAFELTDTQLSESVSAARLQEAISESRNNPNTIELNLLLREDWREILPLRLTSGDIRKSSEGVEPNNVVGLGTVKIESLKANEKLSNTLKKLLKEKLKRASAFDVLKIEVQAADVSELIGIINGLNALPGVLFSEPNSKVKRLSIPNDPRLQELWGLNAIHAPIAWKNGTGTGNKIVAVLDSGVDVSHQDLIGNIWTNTKEIPGNGIDDDNNDYIDDTSGWDFVGNDNLPFDENGHGTHMAGIMAGKGNNGIGIAGVNWSGKIMPIRILNASGATDWNTAFSGIVYAISNGAHILSNSYGSTSAAALAASAVQMANASGKLVIAAAGNHSQAKAIFPAYLTNAYPNVISVASSDLNGSVSEFSNYGDGVDIAAPGSNILSTTPNNGYLSFSGTSAAAPFVAGAASLLWDLFPTKSALEIKSAILNGSDYSKSLDGKISASRQLNVAKAVNELLGYSTQRPSNPPTAIKGVRFKYYEGNWNKLPNLSTVVPTSIGTTDSISLKAAPKNNNFALVFETSIKIEKPGKYKFYVTSDDGSLLYINDKILINNDGVHTPRQKSKSIDLGAGYQKIRVDYFQSRKGKTLQVDFEGPKIKRQDLNKSNLLFYFF